MVAKPCMNFALAGMLIVISAAMALACPICVPSQGGANSPLEQMIGAGALVLADPQDAPQQLLVRATLKGRVAPGSVVEIAAVDMPRAPFEAGKSVILARHPLLSAWQPLGVISRERSSWLRELLTLKPASELTAEEWPSRVRLFADDLFSHDAFVSGVAANQIARAPYAAMRTLRGGLDGAKLVTAANRIENIPHLPLLILLMGVAGDEPSRAFITQRARTAGTLANANELAALLTAQIELDGEGALATRGKQMLLEASPRPSDMSAAVMALGVFAGVFGEARRGEIVSLYRDGMAARPEIAGFVARAMEDWRDWSLVNEVRTASLTKQIDDGSSLLIRSYLEASVHGVR